MEDLGLPCELAFQPRYLGVVSFDKFAIDVQQQLAALVSTELADADGMGFVLDACGLGLIGSVVNPWDGSQRLGSSSQRIHFSTRQIAGGSMFFELGVSRLKIPSWDVPNERLAVDGIGLRFPSVNGFHEQLKTENAWNLLLTHPLCQPVPEEGRFASRHQIVTERP